MGKHTNISNDIFSIFASSAWQLELVKTFPENFTQTTGSKEFIRVSIISTTNINQTAVSGVMLIDIFIEAGLGPNRANIIADKLDKYLAGKTVTTITNCNTQLFSSTLATIGVDPVNASLQRYRYTIPFNYFGV
jgi:hypothetical protein